MKESAESSLGVSGSTSASMSPLKDIPHFLPAGTKIEIEINSIDVEQRKQIKASLSKAA